VLVGGITMVAVTVIWMKLFPSIQRIDQLDQVKMGETEDNLELGVLSQLP